MARKHTRKSHTRRRRSHRYRHTRKHRGGRGGDFGGSVGRDTVTTGATQIYKQFSPAFL